MADDLLSALDPMITSVCDLLIRGDVICMGFGEDGDGSVRMYFKPVSTCKSQAGLLRVASSIKSSISVGGLTSSG